MLALDCETTGLDPFHGSKPFLVAICDDELEVTYWEWPVNPLTRVPRIPSKQLKELQDFVKGQEIVCHNANFDMRMLEMIGIRIDWNLVHDTTLSSHLLNSSRPKDLTYNALYYLDVDLNKYEMRIKDAISKARRYAKKHFPDWLIANRELECMPSAKETVWKSDLWLAAALVRQQTEDQEDHEQWYQAVIDYALSDPNATLLLWRRHKELLEKKELYHFYEERRKVLRISYEMERKGITISRIRLEELIDQYREESTRSAMICENIARDYSYDLVLPQSGNNKSIHEFIFDYLDLEVVKTSSKTGKPSLDKTVLNHWEETLDSRSKSSRFINHLSEKRKRDTAVNYMESYKRFMLPHPKETCVIQNGNTLGNWYVIHPSLNPTGTNTLRWSSRNPNEQNISKKEGFNLRYVYGPAPGREWWSLDYDNLELRIPAYECQEPAMLELFENPEAPPYYGSYHLLIFSILYPDEFCKYGDEVKEKYKSTLYQWTKNGNFAELYGAVDTGDGKSTADRAFHYPGAQAIVAKRLSKKAELNLRWINYANEKGYVETMPDRTVDPNKGYPLYPPLTEYGRISPTVPLNYHVQGTACWVIMKAMVKVEEYLQSLPGYHLVMQIHDELVFDFPKKKDQGNIPIIEEVKRLMESCGDDIGVPLTVGIDYHPNNWSE